MTTDNPKQVIANALEDAQNAIARAQTIDETHDVLSRSERENMTIPTGQIRSVQNSLPDPDERDA